MDTLTSAQQDMLALWKRPSVQSILFFVIGSFMTLAAVGFFTPHCKRFTVRFRIEGAPNQMYHYIMTDLKTTAQSFVKYESGDNVCL